MRRNRIAHLLTKKQQPGRVVKHAFLPKPTWVCSEHSGLTFEGDWTSDSSDTIRALIKQLSGKASENDDLRKEIEVLRQQVQKHEEWLKELFEPSDLPPVGEFEKWLASNDAIKNYSGKHVAFVEGEGIIASSDKLDDLVKVVEAKGNPKGIIFGFVPIPAVFA